MLFLRSFLNGRPLLSGSVFRNVSYIVKSTIHQIFLIHSLPRTGGSRYQNHHHYPLVPLYYMFIPIKFKIYQSPCFILNHRDLFVRYTKSFEYRLTPLYFSYSRWLIILQTHGNTGGHLVTYKHWFVLRSTRDEHIKLFSFRTIFLSLK